MPQGEGTYGKTRGRPPKLRAKKLKDQKGRTGRSWPSHGDVSATGRTGPKAAPHSGRVVSKDKRAKQFGNKGKHPGGAIAMNSAGKYIYGDTYRPYMKKDGYAKI